MNFRYTRGQTTPKIIRRHPILCEGEQKKSQPNHRCILGLHWTWHRGELWGVVHRVRSECQIIVQQWEIGLRWFWWVGIPGAYRRVSVALTSRLGRWHESCLLISLWYPSCMPVSKLSRILPSSNRVDIIIIHISRTIVDILTHVKVHLLLH